MIQNRQPEARPNLAQRPHKSQGTSHSGRKVQTLKVLRLSSNRNVPASQTLDIGVAGLKINFEMTCPQQTGFSEIIYLFFIVRYFEMLLCDSRTSVVYSRFHVLSGAMHALPCFPASDNNSTFSEATRLPRVLVLKHWVRMYEVGMFSLADMDALDRTLQGEHGILSESGGRNACVRSNVRSTACATVGASEDPNRRVVSVADFSIPRHFCSRQSNSTEMKVVLLSRLGS